MSRRGARDPEPELRLRIDAAACDGIGVCAHLAPSSVELDRWGFPIIAGDLAPAEVGAARRAARACPRRALWLGGADAPAAATRR